MFGENEYVDVIGMLCVWYVRYVSENLTSVRKTR
jgi:hypothetical protein